MMRLVYMMFRRADGSPTVLARIVEAVARVLPCAAAASVCGCANIVLRTPISSEPIAGVYQPTREQARFTAMCAVPQSYFHPTGQLDFCVENVFTIPLAVVPAADLVVEAVLDTAFLPADAVLSRLRRQKAEKP